MLDRILVEIDDSNEGARALRVAIELAQKIGADLRTVIVQKPLPSCFSFAVSAIFADVWKRNQADRCAALKRRARMQMEEARIFPDVELVSGEAVSSIVKCAEQFRADLVILGRRRAMRIDHKADGVAERVLCGVLGVP